MHTYLYSMYVLEKPVMSVYFLEESHPAGNHEHTLPVPTGADVDG